jgi:hypothetical protein
MNNQSKEEYLEEKINKLFILLNEFAMNEGIEDFEDFNTILIYALKGFDLELNNKN